MRLAAGFASEVRGKKDKGEGRQYFFYLLFLFKSIS